MRRGWFAIAAWVGGAVAVTGAVHRPAPDGSAPTRPALGFALGRTDRAAVREWASARGAACAEVGPVGMRCTGVGESAVGGVPVALDELLLRFDAGDQLVAVDGVVHGLDAATAATWVTSATDGLARQLGPPRERIGPGWVDHGLTQLGSTFRFDDYRADLRATALAPGRTVVRATFRAIGSPPRPPDAQLVIRAEVGHQKNRPID